MACEITSVGCRSKGLCRGTRCTRSRGGDNKKQVVARARLYRDGARTWELWWGKKKGARTETERKGDRKERERGRRGRDGGRKRRLNCPVMYFFFLFFLDDVESRATSQSNVARFLATIDPPFLIFSSDSIILF